MKIGERVKELRLARGLTQVELSAKSGIGLRTVQRIENNEVNPSIYSINALGEALGVKLNADIFIENEKKFEFKIVISNFSNLLVDTQTLVKRNWKSLIVIFTGTLGILFFKDLKALFNNQFDNSTIFVSTINCGAENECDMELVKKDDKGNVLWKRIIGGTSYDKASQVVKTKEGNYIVVGSTSSFGKGNYDVLVVKVSSNGEILWQKTYGEFLNDYGLSIAEVEDNLYQVVAKKQVCATFNVSNDCYDQEWLFRIDEGGFAK
jgi:transcriptional regulator with XRE-family HTH domain